MIHITPYKDSYRQDMIDMILSIQNEENHLHFTLEEQPDMGDVRSSFLTGGGMFWMAFEDDTLIGTLGLARKSDTVGVLKKSFIRKDKRGTGLSKVLYEKLLAFAKEELPVHYESPDRDCYLYLLDLKDRWAVFAIRHISERTVLQLSFSCFSPRHIERKEHIILTETQKSLAEIHHLSKGFFFLSIPETYSRTRDTRDS